MIGSTEEAGQGQNRVCLRAWAVSMEKDALWPLQCDCYVSTIDGTRIDKCNEEIRQPGVVLRDDVVIVTPTLEDHIERLDEVFACMKRAGLKCKPSKCDILKDSFKYLGRMWMNMASNQTQTQ